MWRHRRRPASSWLDDTFSILDKHWLNFFWWDDKKWRTSDVWFLSTDFPFVTSQADTPACSCLPLLTVTTGGSVDICLHVSWFCSPVRPWFYFCCWTIKVCNARVCSPVFRGWSCFSLLLHLNSANVQIKFFGLRFLWNSLGGTFWGSIDCTITA